MNDGSLSSRRGGWAWGGLGALGQFLRGALATGLDGGDGQSDGSVRLETTRGCAPGSPTSGADGAPCGDESAAAVHDRPSSAGRGYSIAEYVEGRRENDLFYHSFIRSAAPRWDPGVRRAGRATSRTGVPPRWIRRSP